MKIIINIIIFVIVVNIIVMIIIIIILISITVIFNRNNYHFMTYLRRPLSPFLYISLYPSMSSYNPHLSIYLSISRPFSSISLFHSVYFLFLSFILFPFLSSSFFLFLFLFPQLNRHVTLHSRSIDVTSNDVHTIQHSHWATS